MTKPLLVLTLLLVRPTLGVAFFDAADVGVLDVEATARFFDGLRERRLFSLAEGHCLDRLAPENLDRLTVEQRAALVVELSRTFAEHGRYVAPGSEQDDLWNRATTVLTEYLATDPPDATRLRVELQRAFLPAGVGEFLARQVEVQPYDAALRARAAKRLDGALARLGGIEQQLSSWNGPLDGTPSPAEVRTALYNVRFRQAVTRLDRAGLLDRTDPERADQLNRAEKEFVSLAGGDPADVTTQRCHVLLARTRRMKGRTADAARVLDNLLDGDERLSPEVRDELEAERARIILVLGRPDEAAESLLKYRGERGRLPGELRFEMVRSMIGLWRAAVALERPEVANTALERLRTEVAATELEVGGYWAARCRVLLEYAVQAGELGPELAGVIREADGRYLSGETTAAIDGYRRAVEIASQEDREDLRFDFAFTLGSMQLETGRFDAAASEFANLVERFPQRARAPRAGLLAAYALGRVYDRDRTPAAREAYAAALERHRRRFPGDETTGEASWMLARLHEIRLQYTDALAAYLAIPLDHPRGFESAAASARVYEAILRRLRETGRSTLEWERSARQRLTLVTDALPPGRAAPLTRPQAEVAIALARLLVTTEPRDYERADTLLERVTASWGARIGDDLDDVERSRWQAAAREAMQLRVVALAGRGEIERAQRLVERDLGNDPAALLALLDGLTGVLDGADERLTRQLGKLQLAVAEPLVAGRERLDRATAKRLDVCLAEAYLATGRSGRAVEIYERLNAQSPRDTSLARTIGTRLVECGRPECVRVAKPVWRRLERAEREGTPAWFAARYHVAWCALRLGEFDECRKLLGVTRALHPDLGGTAWQAKFDALERELEEAR